MLVKLLPVFKNHEWGGREFIQDLYSIRDRDEPIAEAWYGTHKNGISEVNDLVGDLEKFVVKNPRFLPRGHERLPFMLKILSVEKPLSLQVHPNWYRAQDGFNGDFPGYVDSVGKDELIYALDQTLLLLGFLPSSGIASNFRELTPKGFRQFFFVQSYEIPESMKIRMFFQKLYSLTDSERKELLDEAHATLKRGGLSPQLKLLVSSLQRVNFPFDEYADDVSILAPFFMHLTILSKGESLFIKAGTLHSILHGTVLELQHPSDNVFRCGLTKKETDIEEVFEIADFSVMNPLTWRNSKSCHIAGYILDVIPPGRYNLEKKSTELLLSLQGSGFFFAKEGSSALFKGDCILLRRSEDKFVLDVNAGSIIRVHLGKSELGG